MIDDTKMTPAEALAFMRRAPARNRTCPVDVVHADDRDLRWFEFHYEHGLVFAKPKPPSFDEPTVLHWFEPDDFVAFFEGRRCPIRFERFKEE